MKKGDVWLIGALFAAAVLMMGYYSLSASKAASYDGATYARITVDGRLYQTVELTEQTMEIEIRTKYGYNLLRVHDKGIQAIEADCPDKIDIEMGFKSRIGESIVCLPNRLLIEIIGDAGERSETDATAS